MRHALPLLLVLLLTGCATTNTQKVAVCDGKHRRPANPYGSVLPTAALPGESAPASAAASAKPGEPPTAPSATSAKAPRPVSQLDPEFFESCGRSA